MRIEGEQDSGAFVDAIKARRLVIPDDCAPRGFGLIVIASQRNTLGTNGHAHGQLGDDVGARIVFKDIALTVTAIDIAVVVDTERTADRLPVIDASQVGIAPPDIDLSTGSDTEAAELMTRMATLTPQQVRVLMMLSEGLLNKQIAYQLGVSEATVKAHVSAILQKLGVESRTQAVIAAAKIEAGQWPQSVAAEG